MTSEAELNSKI